jgi:pilus assembly protein CpaB
MLIVAIVAGLVAAAAVFIAVNESTGDSGGSGASGGAVPALLATENISVGTEITDDMVRVTDVPEDLRVIGALTEPDLAVGEVARVAISSGEQITEGKLGVPVPDKGLAGVVPQGMRAAGLEVDEVTAAGGLLLPGDRVDIFAAKKVADDVLRTELVLQDVEVLSVAQEALEASGRADSSTDGSSDAAASSGQLPEDVEEQPDAGTLTLALTPEQVQTLISYHDNEDVENIWAVLRPYGDRSHVDLAPTDVTQVGNNQ